MTRHEDGTVQDALDAYWSARAVDYDAHQVRREGDARVREAWREVWERALPPGPCRVLDVGTGAGGVAHLLAELGHEVVGVDHAEGMLERARSRRPARGTPPTFLHADAVDPGLAAGSFDAVTARHVLWTLREPDRALAGWRRLLRPGGVVVAVDALWYPEGLRPVHEAASGPLDAPMLSTYSDRVLAELPLAQAAGVAEYAALLVRAGFVDVTTEPLTRLHDLDRELGVAPGHRLRQQHRIRGTVPAA